MILKAIVRILIGLLVPFLAFGKSLDSTSLFQWPNEPFYRDYAYILQKLSLQEEVISLLPNSFLYRSSNDSLAVRQAVELAYKELSQKSLTAQKLLQQLNLFDKEIIFIFGDSQSIKVDSWSSIAKGNKTFIFFSRDNFNLSHLMRVLVHELSISYDSKIASLNKLIEAHPEWSQSFDISAAIYNPYLIKGFAAVRAMEMENVVMKEMGLNSEAETFEAPNCKSKIFQVMTNGFIKNDVSLTNMLYVYTRSLLKTFPQSRTLTDAKKMIDLNYLLDVLKQIDLCEFLTEPQVSDLYYSPSSGGPRPRVGDGWGRISQEDTAKKNEEMKQAAAENLEESKKAVEQSPQYKELLKDLSYKDALYSRKANLERMQNGR